MAREEVPLREITTEEIWKEVQELRKELQAHNHLDMGNAQMLTGTLKGITQSSNFVSGSAGAQINWATGNVEFNSGNFRGDISGASGTFTGSISIGSGNNIFKADANGIYLGHATFGSAPFRVSMAGALVATSATVSGAITMGAGSTLSADYINTGTLTARKVITTDANTRIELNPTDDAFYLYYVNILRAKIAGYGIFLYDPSGNQSVQFYGEATGKFRMTDANECVSCNIAGNQCLHWDANAFYSEAGSTAYRRDLGTAASLNKWQDLYLAGNIYVAGTVDGVNVSAHSSRHWVGGADDVIRSTVSSGSSMGISAGWAYTHSNAASAHHSSTSAGLTITPYRIGAIDVGYTNQYDLLPYANNYGQIGYTGKRWDKGHFNNLYCTTQTAGQHITGDLRFRHRGKVVFKIDEGPNFLNFYNKKGHLIMKLNQKGELYVKGKIHSL